MKLNIAVLPGDGIGPEISVQGVEVMSAVCEKFGHEVHYEYALCGADAIDKVDDPSRRRPIGFVRMPTLFFSRPWAILSLIMTRQRKYARSKVFWRCVRSWACSLISVRCRPSNAYCINRRCVPNWWMVPISLCIRELTGGMYFGEKYQDNDKAYDTNMYTRPEIERILKVGFRICHETQ